MTTMQVGILLYERGSEIQISLIEFHSEGVLGFHILQRELRFFALKPVERILSAVYKEPLYRKYAARIRRQGKIGTHVLKREAQAGAAALNRSRPTLRLGNTLVRARVVPYQR